MGRGQTVLGRSVLRGPGGSRFGNARILAGLLIIGVLAANVFAASITFTGGASLGVGTASITGCDDSIKVLPVSEYQEDATPGFYVTAISIGGGADTADAIAAACDGKSVTGVIVGTDGSSVATIALVAITTGGQALTIVPALSAVDVSQVILQIAD